MTLGINVLGSAALAIVEQQLLDLNHRNVPSEGEILCILTDAALANQGTP